MIVVDTSALMAILLGEPAAASCIDVLGKEPEILISAGTLAEALIVASWRDVGDEMAALISGLDPEVVAVTAASSRRMARAYARWGKGVHPAGLNLGDCFAYEAASEHSCPLLFVGDDFAKTDISSALQPSPDQV